VRIEPWVFLLLLLPVQIILAQPVWNFSKGDFVESLDISSDGSYVVASSLHVEAGVGRICLFDKNGTIVWDYLANFPISTAISANGKHIVNGVRSEGIFYLSRKGELVWSYRAGDLYFDVQISSDGNSVAVASILKDGSENKGVVSFYNSYGELLWSYDIGSWAVVSI